MKTSRTTVESFASMVKYSRDQSAEAPSLRICRVIVDPEIDFHFQT